MAEPKRRVRKTPREEVVQAAAGTQEETDTETQVVGKGEAYKEDENLTPEEEEAAVEQHPSVAGHVELEIDKRSPDSHGEMDGRFRKDFVLLGDLDALEDPENVVHISNARGVISQALMFGVHADPEDVTFDGAEQHEDGVSVILHYSANAVPAVVDKGVDTVEEDPEKEHAVA